MYTGIVHIEPEPDSDKQARADQTGEYAHNGAARTIHRGDDDDGFEPTIMRGRE